MRQRTRQQRYKLLWLPALLAAGSGTAILLRLISHPTLRDKATRTALVLSPEYGGILPYAWLSPREALVFDTLKTRNAANLNNIAMYRVEVVTGLKTRLTTLERSLTPDSSLPYYSRVSPNGKRLLICKGSAYQVVDLDGSRLRKWADWKASDNEEYGRVQTFWLADSRHLAQFHSAGAGTPLLPGTPHSLLTRDVDAPADTLRTPLPDAPELEAIDYFSPPSMTSGGALFAYAPEYEENDTRTLLLIHTDPLFAKTTFVKTKTTLHAPPGTTFATAPERRGAILAVSPDGTRVAWLCKTPPSAPPLRAWLHRFLPRVNADPVYSMRLCVSCVDGSKAHEIGSVDVGTTAAGGQLSGAWNSDSAEEISDLRWLPGGKQLSFVLHNALYTVSAEE